MVFVIFFFRRRYTSRNLYSLASIITPWQTNESTAALRSASPMFLVRNTHCFKVYVVALCLCRKAPDVVLKYTVWLDRSNNRLKAVITIEVYCIPGTVQGVPKKIGPSLWLVITLKIINEIEN